MMTTTGTWQFWVKTQSTSGAGPSAIMSKANLTSSFNGITILENVGGTLGVQIKNASSTILNLSTSSSISDNKYHHVALSFQSGSQYAFYFDGVKKYSAGLGGFSMSGQPLRIARAVDTYWKYFNGTVDEIRVDNVVRSDAEIARSYQEGYSRLVFGGTNMTNAQITDSAIYFSTPAHAEGAVDINYTNPDNSSATLSGGYTYADAQPLTITGVEDNGNYYDDVTPLISGGEGTVTATLSKDLGPALPYTSGTPINQNGTYSLTVEDDNDLFIYSFTLVTNMTIIDPTPTKIEDDILQGYITYDGTVATAATAATFNPGYTLQSSGMQVMAPNNTTMNKVGGGTFDLTGGGR